MTDTLMGHTTVTAPVVEEAPGQNYQHRFHTKIMNDRWYVAHQFDDAMYMLCGLCVVGGIGDEFATDDDPRCPRCAGIAFPANCGACSAGIELNWREVVRW